jgi:hypothetical protein
MSEVWTLAARRSPREVDGDGDGKPRRNVSGMGLDMVVDYWEEEEEGIREKDYRKSLAYEYSDGPER